MATKPGKTASKTTVEVHLGREGRPVGELGFLQQGRREIAQFAYLPDWLAAPDAFELSPDLPLQAGFAFRRAPTDVDSVFHLALADTAPDTWGRQVIARAHAKARRGNPALRPLTELDYLCAVDDFSRMGALRLCRDGGYLASPEEGRRRTPPLVELEAMYQASRAIETHTESAEDLRYLQGKGTSLGGMRPKCTVIDENGRLSLGKFPSVDDTFDVTRAEVLALRLAARAGIVSATARVAVVNGTPVAVIERFDRTPTDERIPYLSAASMLQASRQETRSYEEIVDVINRRSPTPIEDCRQLWRRLAFNLLITNVDDHLRNHGFLYAGAGLWGLAPAFDVNPMPGKLLESKTFLTESSGPVVQVRQLLAEAALFRLNAAHAAAVLGEVLDAVEGWRELAQSADIGFKPSGVAHLQPAFEHAQTEEARKILGRVSLGAS